MEHIIVSNVMKHLDENKLLSKYQHGFRNQRSCESQLIGHTSMDQKYQTEMIVLDFAKAFDKVSHPRLLHKLEHYGIHGNNKNWVKSFPNNITQAVTLENTISDNVDVASGVPQGSVLFYSLYTSTTSQIILLQTSDYLLMIVPSTGQSKPKKTRFCCKMT